MALDPHDLPNAALDFLAERHLATLTTLRPDGTPHVVPVGFTWEAATATARVITSRGSRKVANVAAASRAVLCQVDGWRWLSLEGQARVRSEPDAVADAVARYAQRYREPRPNPERVVIEIKVERVLGLVERPATV
ncbi:MAG: pyridoxamine 5'-phosphate oxidase family protein [Actinomycetales bacterium]